MSNSTLYGFTGRILFIDLASRAVRTELLSAEEMRTYGGGSLLSAVLMLKNTRPGLDPMTGDGALVFASSVVAGLPFVGLARFSVCGKSPLTGGFGEARCEGPFAAGLKKSGYDAIVFEGRAPEPVVVRVSGGSAEFSPAGGLWGTETSDATSRLREWFGFDAHVAVIGPAGEAGVRFAAISADLHHQAAGLGMGAAMGAKNLKAVVLTGGAFPNVADADRCAGLTASYRDRIPLNPLTAWQKDEPGFSAWVELHGLDAGLCVQNFSTAEYARAVAYRPGEVMKHYTGVSPCPGCPNDCIKVMRTSDGAHARGIHQPAMGSLGPNLGIWDVASVIDANTRCQELGMDPISLGFTMSMAMECKKEAVGPEGFRQAIPDFGEARRIAELIELIGRRTGVGDLLAEGSRRLAAHLGEGAERYAMHVKGQELPPIEPRTQTNLALGYAVSPVGPRLDICEHDWDFDDRVGWPHTLEYSRTLGILERIPMNELSVRKVRNYKALSSLWSATDALNICIYATPPTRAMSVEELVELVAGVTGWETSAWELMRLGERRFHLLRVYNLREKFTARDDTLPARFFTQAVDAGRLAGSRLDRDVFEDVKRSYYRMMGWTDDGVPRFETLVDHRIEWAAPDLFAGKRIYVRGGPMSVAEPARPGIEADRVGRWLAEHVDGLVGPVEFRLVSGGRSNLTYRLTDAAGATYAVRRPPTGGVLSTAHDVSREWRFISALAPTTVPVPRPVAYCADTAVTGAEFYVMGFVEGLVLADSQAGLALAPRARPSAAEHLVDVLVALHALDPVAVGLGDMVRKTGYVERQLRRWHAQVHATGAPELALLDEVHDLLAQRIPAQADGIVHGDYRPGNVAFGPDGAVKAVFDWELATSGDPMADLGWLAAAWQDPGEQLPPITAGPSTVAGFPARAQLVQQYARRSGRDVSNLPYWVAFSRWRSACIGVGVRARYLAGHMADDGYAAGLLTSAEPGAAGSRVVLAEAARDALRAAGP